MRGIERKMRWVAVASIVLPACQTGGIGEPESQTRSSTSTYTFNCSSDAYVDSAQPTTNYGTSTTLVSGLSNTRIYVKCLATGVNPGKTVTITSAKLRLYVTDATQDGPAVYMAANDSWTETGITWNNQPGPVGPVIDNKGSLASGAYAEWEVKSFASAGDGVYSFVVVPDSTDYILAESRENAGGHKPQLVITTDDPSTTTQFQVAHLPTTSYAGTKDSYLSQASPSTNFGTATSAVVVGGSTTASSAVISWDISTLATTLFVSSASITLNVPSDTSRDAYQVYEVKRGWTDTQVTWNQYVSGSNWQTAGAKGSNDRALTVVGSFIPANTGANTVQLNQAGIAMVERWIKNPQSNHGVLIGSATSTDSFTFVTANGTSSLSPILSVTTFAACNKPFPDIEWVAIDRSLLPLPISEGATPVGDPGTGFAGLPAGGSYNDTAFGTHIVRVTKSGKSTHGYSFWGEFSKNSTWLLILKNDVATVFQLSIDGSGNVVTKDCSTDSSCLSPAQTIAFPSSTCEWIDAQWSHTDDDTLYCRSKSNASEKKLYSWNVRSPGTAPVTVAQFGGTGGLTPSSACGNSSWGSNDLHMDHLGMSAGDNVFTFSTTDSSGAAQAAVAYVRPIGGETELVCAKTYSVLNEVNIDKTGTYASVIYGSGGFTHDIWDFRSNTTTTLTDSPDRTSGHFAPGSGWEVGTDDTDAGILTRDFTTAAFTHIADSKRRVCSAMFPACNSGETCDTTLGFCQNGTSESAYHVGHFSANQSDERWATFSYYREQDTPNNIDEPWEDEVMAVSLNGNWVRHLAHHHSVVRTAGTGFANEYYDQPRVSVSYDGRWAVFTSNYNGPSGHDATHGYDYQDVFLIKMPEMCAP